MAKKTDTRLEKVLEYFTSDIEPINRFDEAYFPVAIDESKWKIKPLHKYSDKKKRELVDPIIDQIMTEKCRKNVNFCLPLTEANRKAIQDQFIETIEVGEAEPTMDELYRQWRPT